MLFHRRFYAAVALFWLLLTVLPVQAAVLFNVDITDVRAVKISSTGAASGASDRIGAGGGLTLVDFFVGTGGGRSIFGNSARDSDLVPVGANRPLTGVLFPVQDDERGINLFEFDAGTIAAVEGQPFSTGSVTLDLSRFADILPEHGAVGDVVLGDLVFIIGSGTVLGQFNVIDRNVAPVPLPAGGVLLLAGLGALAFGRLRAR